MRRRPAPPPSAQQMIREYLGRVSVAATKVLPKGDRLLFVGRTRAAIEARVGPLASADVEDVVSALNALGDPEELAKAERERLYSARRRGAAAAPPTLWKPSKEPRRGGAPPPPPPPRRPDRGQARRSRLWPHRGLTGPDEPQPTEAAPPAPPAEPAPAGPRPAGSPEATAPPETPVPEPPAAVSPPSGETTADAAPAHGPTAGVPGEDHPGPSLNGREPGGTPPDWMRPERPASERPASERPAPERPASERPASEPPAPERPAAESGETIPESIVPGMEQPADPEDEPALPRRPPTAAVPLTEAWALARKHPLEAVSIVLLGVGGLILPFPFWLIGGLVALRSRRWDARDKWMALAGPLLITFVVLLIRAGTSQGNFFPAFYHAAGNDFGRSIRAGCVLCAAYLTWRLRRGPRVRTLPPWQRPR